MALWPVHPAI